MNDAERKEADYTILSTPTAIWLKCPHCNERVVIDVNKLQTTNIWEGGVEECPKCHKEIDLKWSGTYD